MRIQNESGDKKYFTIIPNYIANHSSANDQALYLQMKKIVGEGEGICYASEKYFKSKLKIGSKALKNSINYLIEHGWIENAGTREIQTQGGVQKSQVYLVKDIWEMNVNYYKGVSESEPLDAKGVSESNQRGVPKLQRGVQKSQRGSLSSNKEEEEHNKNIKEEIYSPEFLEFWKIYPRKEEKHNAFVEWKKLAPSQKLQRQIIGAVENYKKTKKWQEGYVKYAVRFLKGRMWEDEIISDNEIDELWKLAK